jgi:DNA polymerase IV
MRFVCLLVEHLPTRVETLREPALIGKPLVVLRDWDSRVLDASPEALTTGVAIGDSRQRVEQLCPQAIIRPANEALYQSHHIAVRNVLAQFANAVESGDWGELTIELSALARSFPSEEALAVQLIQQLDQATPLQPVLGLASNKFTTRQAAQQVGTQAGRILIVPTGGERRFLEPLPLKVMPDPPAELLRRLHLFGITTLGGFAQLPHAAVVPQFGSDLAFYHDLARGIDPRPLIPETPPPVLGRTLRLPEPLTDRAMVLAAVERLASRVAHRLQESGYHALALSLTMTTTDRCEHSSGISVKPPSSDAELLRRHAGRLLGKLSFEAEVTTLTLTAYPLREWHHGAQQLSLLDVAVPPKIAQLRSVIRLLQQRFGEAVIRLASLIGPPLPLPIRIGAKPDGTPLGIGWGGWSSRVTNVYETWREQRTWWEHPVTRDYYEIEAENGVVFTLFRDEQGQWFLDRRRHWEA